MVLFWHIARKQLFFPITKGTIVYLCIPAQLFFTLVKVLSRHKSKNSHSASVFFCSLPLFFCHLCFSVVFGSLDRFSPSILQYFVFISISTNKINHNPIMLPQKYHRYTLFTSLFSYNRYIQQGFYLLRCLSFMQKFFAYRRYFFATQKSAPQKWNFLRCAVICLFYFIRRSASAAVRCRCGWASGDWLLLSHLPKRLL